MTKKFNLVRKALNSSAFMGVLAFGIPASAFCGFYVAKGGTGLFNESSKVVLVRDGDRTVITMANDYQGDMTEFAMVIPVPTIITKDQVHISKASILDHIDAYTAPRLVEYFDPDPCAPQLDYALRLKGLATSPMPMPEMEANAGRLGVTIEESFSVGEYDILILSAKESGGLQIWLTENGYKVPDGAEKILKSYIKQGMKFFVAKVNLEEKAKVGGEMLRPIAVAFESPKFILPIRLGTVNSKGSQDLFVYALTKNGRVETTNYRTQKIPSNKEIPVFVKDEFGKFYKDMYGETARKEGGKGVFMEYAWDMGWCDPCAAEPLSKEELRELGVFWLDGDRELTPTQKKLMRRPAPRAQNVFVTRLHIRYDAQSFPEDLKFHQTGDKTNFQGRYIMHHAYKGEMKCEAAIEYKRTVNKRLNTEINTLANLTGWERAYIRTKIDEDGRGIPFELNVPTTKDNWWNRIWPKGE